MEEDWKPFEVRETEEGTTLYLRGTEESRVKIEADKVAKILEAIKRGWNVAIEYADIEGDIDIEEVELEQDDRGYYIIPGSLGFRSVEFQGDADFSGSIFQSNADFFDSIFQGDVGFSASIFADADFSGSIFQSNADFPASSFQSNVGFIYSIFQGDVNFTYSSFQGDAVFFRSSFQSIVGFMRSSFQGDADFSGSIFQGYETFLDSSFQGDANFLGSSFERPGNFSGVVVLGNTVPIGLWNEIIRHAIWFPGSAVFLLWKKMERREHAKTNFSCFCEFICDLSARIHRTVPITGVYSLNTNIVMDASSNPRLKRYIDDEQWIHSWRTNPKGRWWREPVFRFWELTSHCGRSIGLWVFWSVLIAVVFAFIYQAFGGDSITFSVDMAGKQPDLKAYLYYSVVTFTTLGFGDIIPKTNWARLAVGAEVVLGYVMLGGLISIFANKLARRS